MGTTVNNVESGNRENERTLRVGKVSNVSIERNSLVTSTSLSNGKRDTKDSIGTKLALVLSSVKLEEELINSLLVNDSNLGLNKSRANDLVNVINSLLDTLKTRLLAPLSLCFSQSQFFTFTYPCQGIQP
jgi:hypothetical protein